MIDQIKPAIVAVGYNRPESMCRLLESIEEASYPSDDVTLIISIDRSDIYEDVVKAANKVKWSHGKKIIRTFPERQGLRKHILQCGDLSEKYGAVIILEDDLVVSPAFYNYVYQAVNYYKGDDQVCGIALYSHSWNGYQGVEFIPVKNDYDVFMGQFSITWGQCWTSNQWTKFKEWYACHCDKLPKRNDMMPEHISHWSEKSWGKYFISYIVENNLYYVIPYSSMSSNFSECGEHNSFKNSSHQVPVCLGKGESEYRFTDFKSAIKYDSFFERIYSADILNANFGTDKVLIDLNGSKVTTADKSYLLTTKKLQSAIIKSYGLSMHPIDLNVDYGVSGNDIFLYNVGENFRIPYVEKLSQERAYYEIYGLSWKNLFRALKYQLKNMVLIKMRKMLNKKI